MTLVSGSASGAIFSVSGSHVYDVPGSFTVTMTVKDMGGQQLNLTSTADVADDPIYLFAVLDPRSDHGASNSDGITNDKMPTFLGGSEPNSHVALSVTSTSGTVIVSQGVTDADGRFSVTVNKSLADGVYTVSVTSSDAAGHTTPSYILPQQLVIDTVGPKVTGVQFSQIHSQILVTLADDRSGIDQASLIDGSYYHFRKYVLAFPNRNSPNLVTSLQASSTAQPTDPQTVTVSIKNGRYRRGGRYLLTIDSVGARAPCPTPASVTSPAIRSMASSSDTVRLAKASSAPNSVAGLDAIHRISFAPGLNRNGHATPLNLPSTPAARNSIPAVFAKRFSARAVAAARLAPRGPAHAMAKTARSHAARLSMKLAKTRGH